VIQRTLVYSQLRAAWFVIADAHPCPAGPWAANRCFCELLAQAGWTVAEWNDEVAARESRSRKRPRR